MASRTAARRAKGMVIGIDNRSCSARALRESRDRILASLPQPIDPLTAVLVERVAMIEAHLARADQVALQRGLNAAEARSYMAMSSLLSRLLRQIGASRKAKPQHNNDGPSLSEIISAHQRGAAA
jgi:hypothetical protein